MSIFDVTPVSVADYRQRARRRLPGFLFHYIDGGANDEQTLASNVSDFSHYCLKQRVMRNVDGVDTSTTLSGRPASMPVALAPVGMAGMFARRGETQAAGCDTLAFTVDLPVAGMRLRDYRNGMLGGGLAGKLSQPAGDQTEVYMDGGVRSGIDVVKAVALGAKGVLIGRPWVYAMSAHGERGVADLLALFKQEIAVAMALMGVRSIDQITPDLIEHSGEK